MGMPGLGALGVTFGDSRRHGQPVGTQARLVQLGQHAVARDEPRLHPHGDQPPRAALVYRRPGGARGRPGQSRSGATASRRTSSSRCKDKKLLPVAELDRGFIHPEYPEQVLVSYFQAGRICDYIQERWGADKLLDMVHAFAELTPTPEVIQQSLGLAPEAVRRAVPGLALPGRRARSSPSSTSGATRLKHLVELVDKRSVRRGARAKAKRCAACIRTTCTTPTPYEFLAEIEIAKGDKAAALAVLVDYQKYGGEQSGDAQEAGVAAGGAGTASRRGRDARRASTTSTRSTTRISTAASASCG